jgi:hypothetical protein
MPIEQAKLAMRKAGFTDEKTHIDERDEPGCRPRVVCNTYPAALERAGQTSDRYLTTGVDHTAPPPRPEPPDDETKPEEPPAAPPPKPPDSYF